MPLLEYAKSLPVAGTGSQGSVGRWSASLRPRWVWYGVLQRSDLRLSWLVGFLVSRVPRSIRRRQSRVWSAVDRVANAGVYSSFTVLHYGFILQDVNRYNSMMYNRVDRWRNRDRSEGGGKMTRVFAPKPQDQVL